MKPTLTPYLSFNGQAKEAMEFYKSVLGGILTMQTFGESGMPVDPQDKDRLVHALLRNDTLTFMASDGTKDHVVHMGDNICMSIVGSDKKLLTKYFNELSKGGKITMKLEKQFWGDVFGSFTDKFGVNWMINIGTNFQ